ncbi:MAG: urease accessory protein UreD [Microthrixaceae bacterium]
MRAELRIELRRGADGGVRASGNLATAPYWCRWDGDTLWIVGSAACPVGEDSIVLTLDVGPGVHAAVRGVAATIVYTGTGGGTSIDTRLLVAEDASLHWSPEPVIVTALARHRSRTTVHVATGATVRVDETLVLGRRGERAGAIASGVRVVRDDTTVLRSSFDTGQPGWDGPGGTGGASVVGTRLLVEPTHDGTGDEVTPTPPLRADLPPASHPAARAAVLRTEHGDRLVVGLGEDPDEVAQLLDRALDRALDVHCGERG